MIIYMNVSNCDNRKCGPPAEFCVLAVFINKMLKNVLRNMPLTRYRCFFVIHVDPLDTVIHVVFALINT